MVRDRFVVRVRVVVGLTLGLTLPYPQCAGRVRTRL